MMYLPNSALLIFNKGENFYQNFKMAIEVFEKLTRKILNGENEEHHKKTMSTFKSFSRSLFYGKFRKRDIYETLENYNKRCLGCSDIRLEVNPSSVIGLDVVWSYAGWDIAIKVPNSVVMELKHAGSTSSAIKWMIDYTICPYSETP